MSALEGCVAIVTGGSRGIGKGCALELGAAGATVYVTGRGRKSGGDLPGTIDQTAEELTAEGGRGVAVQCDHRNDAEVEALFERVQRDEARLDLLVNNAFIIPPELTSGKKFWEVPLSNWDDMFDVGTRSAYVASVFAARQMIPAKRGLIANISSSGAAKYAWHVAYGVGKCALDRVTADTAHELLPHGIAVVSLWPSLVLTERIQANLDKMPGLAKVKAESQRFTGRAVAALAADPKVMRHSGRALASRALADVYGFTDLDGSLPDGPLEERSID